MTSSIFFLPAFVALLLLTTVSAMGKICPPANLCFAIDESGSITPTQFKQQADAINAIVDAFNGLAPGSSYSAVGFSTTSTPVSALTSDRALFKSRITANKQSGGNTSSGSGLNACSAILTPAKRPRVLVLITDGRDNTNPRGKDVAPGIKMKDISIATVGVGPGVSDQTLMDIASTPKLFTAVTNFAMLPKEINAIVATLCVDPTPSPSVTPTRSSTPTPSVTPTRSSTPTPSITPTRSSTPTPSVTPTRSASPTPSGTPTPSPSPMPRCANVDCARCGKVLECYVSSGSLKFDKWVCGAVVNKRVFCEKKKKTKCGQSCRGLKQGIKCFPGTKWPKCPAVIFAKGRAARCRGGGRKIKRGGGRGWDWDNDKHGKGGKHGKAGKRRFKRHVVETFASYRICMKGKKLKIKCKQWRCFKGKCRCFA